MQKLRGLFALTIILIFTNVHAKFLYKDDVVNNPLFDERIEKIGSELYKKTGISLYLVMVRDFDENQTISDFEKSLVSEIQEPAIIMTFVELKQQVDILVRPQSLYKDFNKAQVLSPNATFIGSVISAVMFARSFDEASELISTRGGTILPILAQKTKGQDTIEKYSVAMFNGYSDVAEQVAKSRGVVLENAAGNGSKDFIDIIRLIFYGVIVWAIFIFVRQKYFKKDKDV